FFASRGHRSIDCSPLEVKLCFEAQVFNGGLIIVVDASLLLMSNAGASLDANRRLIGAKRSAAHIDQTLVRLLLFDECMQASLGPVLQVREPGVDSNSYTYDCLNGCSEKRLWFIHMLFND